jgi:hypothetical protein
MKGVGTDIGTIHFVGIGGIGMSGIAEVMHNMGYSVQGSDIAESYVVEGLRKRGIAVMIGHKAENVEGAAVVVTSTAVRRENPEVVAALEARVPVVRRAEMLAELMRLKNTVAVAGTHGKTTTTSMVAALLDAGGVDPTVINGGIINSYGSNARLGASDWMVVEADESDGSFLRLDGTLAIVTNIDPEHLDHYGSFDRVKSAFVEFIENVPFYGAAMLCIDHPEVQAIIPKVRDRRVITYGFSAQADVRGEGVTPIPAATASPPSCASATARSAASRASNCPCPAATTCRTRWPRWPSPWKWACRMTSSAPASASSAGSSAALPRWARSRWTAVRPWSSTITAITRSKSAPCSPPRAKACRTASSPWSSRTASPACAITWKTSRAHSTMPTWSMSRRSIPPAKRRSRAWTRPRWSKASRRGATVRRT